MIVNIPSRQAVQDISRFVIVKFFHNFIYFIYLFLHFFEVLFLLGDSY